MTIGIAPQLWYCARPFDFRAAAMNTALAAQANSRSAQPCRI